MVQKIILLIFILSLGCAATQKDISLNGINIDLGTTIKENQTIELPFNLKTHITIMKYDLKNSYIIFKLPNDFFTFCEESDSKSFVVGNILTLYKNNIRTIFISSQNMFLNIMWTYNNKHIVITFSDIVY